MQFFWDVLVSAAHEIYPQYKNGNASLLLFFVTSLATLISVPIADVYFLLKLRDERFEIPLWLTVVYAGLNLCLYISIWLEYRKLAAIYLMSLPEAGRLGYQ